MRKVSRRRMLQKGPLAGLRECVVTPSGPDGMNGAASNRRTEQDDSCHRVFPGQRCVTRKFVRRLGKICGHGRRNDVSIHSRKLGCLIEDEEGIVQSRRAQTESVDRGPQLYWYSVTHLLRRRRRVQPHVLYHSRH